MRQNYADRYVSKSPGASRLILYNCWSSYLPEEAHLSLEPGDTVPPQRAVVGAERP